MNAVYDRDINQRDFARFLLALNPLTLRTITKAEHDALVQVVQTTSILALSNTLHDIATDAHGVFLERLRHLQNPASGDQSEQLTKLKRRLADLLTSLRTSSTITEDEQLLISQCFHSQPVLLDQLQDLIFQKCSDATLCDWICSVLPQLDPGSRFARHSPGSDRRTIMWRSGSELLNAAGSTDTMPVSCSVPVTSSVMAPRVFISPPAVTLTRAVDDLAATPARPDHGLDRARYATRDELILNLIGPNEQVSFRHTFFLCYRPFVPPPMLLDRLLNYYQQPPVDLVSSPDAKDPASACRLKIAGVLLSWLRDYFQLDFSDPMNARLTEFLANVSPSDAAVSLLQKTFDACRRGLRTNRRRSSSLSAASSPTAAAVVASPPTTPARVPASGAARSDLPIIDCLAWRATDIAKAITLNEWAAFHQIDDTELIDQNWKSAPHKAVNALAFAQRFNRMTYWVASVILNARNREIRAQILQHFVAVGTECLRLHNFHAAFAVSAAFMLHPVQRLKELRYALDNRFASLMEELKRFTESSNNYRLYRQALQQQMDSGSPCVPHMAVTFKDLYALQEITPVERREGVADLMRLNRIAEQITLFSDCHSRQFDTVVLACPPALQTTLGQLIAFDYPEFSEDVLLKRSLSLEPKMTWAQYRDAVAIAILRNEGFL